MGKVFLVHPEGSEKIYTCVGCRAPLTNLINLRSTRFTSSSGPAYLFQKVVNVTHGDITKRDLITGVHLIRDVFCKRCNGKVGWFYEFAVEPRQRYKEGCTVLERALIRKSRGTDYTSNSSSSSSSSDTSDSD